MSDVEKDGRQKTEDRVCCHFACLTLVGEALQVFYI